MTSTFIFLSFLLCQGKFEKRMLQIFILLVLSDVMLFYYENHLVNTATFIVRIIAYVGIITLVFPELKNIRTNVLQKFFFIGIFGVNLGMLLLLVEMIPDKYRYPMLDSLFYCYGISMMILISVAVTYNNRFSDKRSIFYAAAAICLVFSDITSFIAYYLEFEEFYVPDRVFYLLGLSALLKFATLDKSPKAVSDLEYL